VLAFLKLHWNRVQCLLTDLVLPDMHGNELIERTLPSSRLAPVEREPSELFANVLQASAQPRGFAAQIGGRVSQGDALTLETA
jgi:hypothetical protein